MSVQFFDATLRDGCHVIKHKLSLGVIEKYCSQIDGAGLDAIIIGHGNGLGASSLQVGLSEFTDIEMLTTAKNALKKTKLGIFMMPGFATIKDNLIPAVDLGVDVFKIASHCTEADIMKQHIEYLSKRGKAVYGVLMSIHMIESLNLLEQAKKIESYGAKGLILMDSAGASTREDVIVKVSSLVENTSLKIGFHGHNSLGLAISNTICAVEECGATIVDGTLSGFGAGAGNCQLEAIIALLQKKSIREDVNLYQIMDVAEEVIKKDLKYSKGLDKITLTCGICGVLCLYAKKVEEASKTYNVDSRDIFKGLSSKKIVGGQDDMILEVVNSILENNKGE